MIQSVMRQNFCSEAFCTWPKPTRTNSATDSQPIMKNLCLCKMATHLLLLHLKTINVINVIYLSLTEGVIL